MKPEKSKAIEPDLNESEQKDLVRELLDECIGAGLRSTDSLVERWNKQEAQYLGIAKVDRKSGESRLHYPLVGPLLNKLADMMASVLNGERSRAVANTYAGNSTRAKPVLERTLDFFLTKDNMFETAVLEALVNTGYQHRTHATVFFQTRGKRANGLPQDCFFKTRTLDARHTSIFPATQGSLEDKKLIAWRFTDLVQYFQDAGNRGIYANTEKILGGVSGDQTSLVESAELRGWMRGEISAGSETENQFEAAWTGFYWWKKKSSSDNAEPASRYLFTVTETSRQLLRFKKLPYDKLPMATTTFKSEPNRYWPETGLATDLQALQSEINDVVNIGLDGWYRANLQMFKRKASLAAGIPGGQQVVSPTPGGIIDADIEQLIMRSDVQGTLAWKEDIWNRGQLLISLANINFGQTLEGDHTLGEAQMVQSQTNTTFDVRTRKFANEWCRALFESMVNQLYYHWNEWFPIYGQMLDLTPEDRAIFMMPVNLQAASTSLRHTPMGRRQEAAQLQQMLMGSDLKIFVDQAGYALAKEIEASSDIFAGKVLMKEQQAIEMLNRLAQEEQQRQALEAAAAVEGAISGGQVSKPGGTSKGVSGAPKQPALPGPLGAVLRMA